MGFLNAYSIRCSSCETNDWAHLFSFVNSSYGVFFFFVYFTAIHFFLVTVIKYFANVSCVLSGFPSWFNHDCQTSLMSLFLPLFFFRLARRQLTLILKTFSLPKLLYSRGTEMEANAFAPYFQKKFYEAHLNHFYICLMDGLCLGIMTQIVGNGILAVSFITDQIFWEKKRKKKTACHHCWNVYDLWLSL